MKSLINKVLTINKVANYLTQLRYYKHLITSRKALAKLSDTMLEDIGITRAEAEKEAAKPFWKNEGKPSPYKKIKHYHNPKIVASNSRRTIS